MERRRFLKFAGGAGMALVAVLVPAWLAYRGERNAGAVSALPLLTVVPDPASTAPEPLGAVTGNDGRPITHNLDIGRILDVGAGWAVLRSGIGPRLVRLSAETTVTFEASDTPYAVDSIAQGDWAEVAGETLADYSLAATHVTLNSMGNMIGVLDTAADNHLTMYARSGREKGVFAQDPVTLVAGTGTKFFAGRGNFDTPNRTAAELQRGSWVMCNGYRSRAGKIHATECFFGNELPPGDAPTWLLDRISR